MSISRVLASLFLLAAGVTHFIAPVQAEPASNAEADRVIVIGVDGGDGRTVEEMMDKGELPNMQRLRDMGTFARLGTSLPAESPTAWASLNTGRNPAETAVPGFVRRNFSASGSPTPGFGHLVSETRELDTFGDRPFTATNTQTTWYGIGFGVAFLVFLIAFKFLLRMRTALAVVLALVLGGVGAWAGGSMRGHYPNEYPRYTNPLVAQNFWDIAGEAGVNSIVLDSAQSFDSDSPDDVNVLHGLGVPDARGGIGDWQIYTTDVEQFGRVPAGTRTSTAGTIFKVDRRDGAVKTTYYGPKNFAYEEELEGELDALNKRLNDPSIGYKESQTLRAELGPRASELKKELAENIDIKYGIPMELSITPDDAGKYDVKFGDQSQKLAVGDWSDFYHLTFSLTPMVKVHGVTRCKLVSDQPDLKLFINTLDIAPESPPFWQEVTSPADYAASLASGGSFETYGWACMTMPFKDGEIGPELLLEDIEFTFKWRERLFFDQLARGDWRLLMGVFSTPDRVQHMTYQYYDEGHPMYDPEVANREIEFFGETIKLKEAVPAIFKQVDRVVGRVLDEVLQPGDELMMCADHGFQTFRHQVNINNLLAETGFLVLKPGVSVTDGSSLMSYVDWSKTRAYSMGLGFVYLNLRGREKNGIVAPEDVDATVAELKAAMLAWTDPDTDKPVLDDVYVTSEIHSGDYLKDESELIMGFTPTYRVSWKTTSGKIKLVDGEGGAVLGPVVEDNTSPWSGGHPSVAEPAVRGLFFSSKAVELPEGGPRLLHIAPTVLSMLGVEIPAEMDLPPLKVK